MRSMKVFDEVWESEYGRKSGTGKVMYQFDEETGVLEVAMSPGQLETLVQRIGEIPPEGKDVAMSTKFYREHVIFNGVKKILQISTLTGVDYVADGLAADPNEIDKNLRKMVEDGLHLLEWYGEAN